MLPLSKFSGGVLAEIIRRQSPSKARTAFAWQLAVGPALARATTVQLVDGVLKVRALDVRWLKEITRAREVILTKLQELLGKDAVTRITVNS